VNSTVSGNEAQEGSTTGASIGGGVDAEAGVGPITVVHSTIVDNEAAQASAIQSVTAIPTLRGSILDKTSSAANVCQGTISTSGGYNVAGDATCAPNGTTDVPSVNPQLGLLTDNGGPSAGAPGFLMALSTHLPALGSPALDRVPVADCDDSPAAVALTVDERGLPRPVDGDGNAVALCDSGSVERAAPPDGDGDGLGDLADNCPAQAGPVSNGGCPVPAAAPAPAPVPKKKCKKGRKLKKGKCVKKKKRKK
jgi:hypothetical protein